MTDSATKYKSFDFASNSQWKSYLENFYPVPKGGILEKKKRQWYKKNIDSDFDIEFEPIDSNTSSSNTQPPPENNQSSTSSSQNTSSQQQQ
mmetsp:Transcript_15172/g.12924  ORF Transcript_15172/g.12924 Transcript_15172/m.12924 type:complete len:91 (-) Transcript_15172:671-943(-)